MQNTSKAARITMTQGVWLRSSIRSSRHLIRRMLACEAFCRGGLGEGLTGGAWLSVGFASLRMTNRPF
jgi:hypothetical protein